jgi:hypothetical protein
MHHHLSRPDWLEDLNTELAKRGLRNVLGFDRDFVLVEEDWANGRYPEDVAGTIADGKHGHVEPKPFNAAANG